jgi:hypothetical protein
MSGHPHFIIGASLGTGTQPTAIAVLEQEVLKKRDWPAETGTLSLRYLARLALDVNYPQIVAETTKFLEAPEIKDKEGCGKSEVLLDLTGCGRAVVELFERDRIEPLRIWIVGAGRQEEQASNGAWHIPKVELIGVLRVLYEAERLKMAKDLDLVPTLLDELRSFKVRAPRIDPNDPESWREGQHDDLVFAVALTAWRASRHVPYPRDDEPEFRNRPIMTGSHSWMAF